MAIQSFYLETVRTQMIKLPKDTAQAILSAYERALKPKSSLGFNNDKFKEIAKEKLKEADKRVV